VNNERKLHTALARHAQACARLCSTRPVLLRGVRASLSPAHAEHAIKQFAYYREYTIGTLKETGLSDYLVLLSICQTCRYKGASFLKFLLSKERDVDVFCQRKQRRRPTPPVELYPQGFVPPHLANLDKRRLRQSHDDDEESL